MHLNPGCKVAFPSFSSLLLPQHFTFTSVLYPMLLLAGVRTENKTWGQFLSLLQAEFVYGAEQGQKEGQGAIGRCSCTMQAYMDINLEHESLAICHGRISAINRACHYHLSYLQAFNLYKGDHIALSAHVSLKWINYCL